MNNYVSMLFLLFLYLIYCNLLYFVYIFHNLSLTFVVALHSIQLSSNRAPICSKMLSTQQIITDFSIVYYIITVKIVLQINLATVNARKEEDNKSFPFP